METTLHELSVTLPQASQCLTLIEKVSFVIQPGEIMALVGESGCGKSMMATALIRLLPPQACYSPDSIIQLDTLNLLTLPEYKMRALRGKRIGMVFQEPMTALNPVLTIRTQLAEAFLLHKKLSAQALEQRLIQALQEVEIADPHVKLSQYPHQLSGGQKQRIVIAMALAGNPDLLIADEPTTALDVTVQAQILDLLKRLQQHRHMSILLITHDLHIVRTLANRICVMYAGEIIQLATVSDFFKEIRHPYVQQLLASLPHYHNRAAPLTTMAGLVPSPSDLPAGCRFHPRCPYAFKRCQHTPPTLLPWKSGAVRCYLYEEGKPLPSTAITPAAPWKRSPSLEEEPLFDVRNLSITFQVKLGLLYKTTLTAVKALSFSVPAGKTLAIVGESGSGKTTLGRALVGLQLPSHGEILYRQRNLSHFTALENRRFRREVQMVFQDPYTSLDPRMTVEDILAEGMRVQGLTTAAIAQKQRALLDQVALPLTSLRRYPHEFSGGQRQRISIARALSTDPQILICDEPTSALDISVQAQVLNLFKTLQETHGLTYIFITHNMNVVAYLADEVLVMQNGRLVEQGDVKQILHHPRSAYTKQLLTALVSA